MILKNEAQENAMQETAALAQCLQVNNQRFSSLVISDIFMNINNQYVHKLAFMKPVSN